jgi:hypothetical protein
MRFAGENDTILETVSKIFLFPLGVSRPDLALTFRANRASGINRR